MLHGNVNVAAVNRHFSTKRRSVSSSMTKREKAFTPGGSGPGDVVAAALHRQGASLAAASGGDSTLSTAAQFAKHFSSVDAHKPDNLASSCFAMRCQKTLHEKSLPQDEKRRLQNFRDKDVRLDKAIEFRKNMYARRHEECLATRRLKDPYVNLFSSQIDRHEALNLSPSRYGAHSEAWIIGNDHRQQLSNNGQPLMTRIMHGDFYHPEEKRVRIRNDHISLNKKHLRSASAASRSLRQSMSVS